MRNTGNILFYTLLLSAIFLAFPQVELRAADWQSQAMVKPREGAMPLIPFLDYYIDQSRSMDIEEVSQAALSADFKPLVLDELPRVEGITWLRFTIAPLPPEARPGAFLLDMGQSVPGVPVLFDPERNELSGALEWQEKIPSQRNILLLPEEGSQAITCFIKIDGLPGPWFAPMIRTPQNAASNLTSLARNAAILALGVVMLICLLRGLGEKGQWRIWTALFVAVALAQALLGMPAVSEKFSPTSVAAILCPGIALMLLPHVGRHLLLTPKNSKKLDIQLFLLSLPGAAVALWPLVPGWAWLERWVDLWPLCILIFVPTALGAWIMGLGGSKRFLAACFIPPLFTGAALGGLDFGFPPSLLASLPIWGVALCALLIAATKSPIPHDPSKNDPTPGDSGQPKNSGPLDSPIIPLDHPLDDPNLRLLPSQEVENSDLSPKVKYIQTEYNLDTPERSQSLEERENALRTPLDEILRQGAALGQCSLPPAVRQYAESMIAAANTLGSIISGVKLDPDMPGGDGTSQNTEQTFSLQRLLRNVHDSVASFAESGGTALSWYVPPNLGRLYQGNGEGLENTLRLLLESSVRASKNGSVHISARLVPGSDDPGHILFSITDNGHGVPPKDRSSLAIAKAWELVGQQDGYLTMETGPDGMDIALSLRFPVEEEEEEHQKSGNHVVLASDNPSRRRELAKAISELPCRISQVGSAQEVLVCQSIDPAGLLVAHGQLARPAAADTIHKFAELAREAGFAQTFVLAITEDDKQWHLLKPSGFTHAMLEPENLETLKETINGLLSSLNRSAPDAEEGDSQAKTGKEEASATDNIAETASLFIDPKIYSQEKPSDQAKRGTSTSPLVYSDVFPHEDSGSFEGPAWLVPEPLENGQDSEIAADSGKTLSSNPVKMAAQAKNVEASQQDQYNSIMEYVVGSDKGTESADAAMSEPSPDQAALSAKPTSDSVKETQAQSKGVSGDPVVIALIRNLDEAMVMASKAFEKDNYEDVADATGQIIKESENVGLRLLARMASCVEMAAKEKDKNALSDLLPELALAVERNRLALSQNMRTTSRDQA